MDPGNWATDLEGGARFGYQLLWVLVLSNLMAILLQTLSARLGIVTQRDLAQACRETYPRPVTYAPIYYPSATDVAEAAVVRLLAGQEQTGIDMTMRLVPTARIDDGDAGAHRRGGLTKYPAEKIRGTAGVAHE